MPKKNCNNVTILYLASDTVDLSSFYNRQSIDEAQLLNVAMVHSRLNDNPRQKIMVFNLAEIMMRYLDTKLEFDIIFSQVENKDRQRYTLEPNLNQPIENAYYTRENIRNACEKADLILIAVHGIASFHNKGKTLGCNEVYIDYKDEKRYIKCEDLGCLINYLLMEYKRGFLNILLSICYAARSAEYTLNHNDIEALSQNNGYNLKSSFAYKLGKNLASQNNKRLQVTLSARTGALAFEYSTGNSYVLPEPVVAVEILKKIPNCNNYELARTSLINLYESEINNYQLPVSINNTFTYITTKKRLSNTPKKNNNINKPSDLEKLISDGFVEKTGKIIYTFNDKTCEGFLIDRIIFKYPEPQKLAYLEVIEIDHVLVRKNLDEIILRFKYIAESNSYSVNICEELLYLKNKVNQYYQLLLHAIKSYNMQIFAKTILESYGMDFWLGTFIDDAIRKLKLCL